MNIKQDYKNKVDELLQGVRTLQEAKKLIQENDFNISMDLLTKSYPASQKVDLYNYKEIWQNEIIEETKENIQRQRAEEKEKKENEKYLAMLNREEAKRRKELEKQAREQLKEEERRKQQKNVLIAVVLACMVYFITIIYMIVGR